MTCKDCVHYELCFDYTHLKHSKNLPDNREDVCEHFKNKADFVEVKHGEWKQEDDDIFCSECGKGWNVLDNCTETFDYCPKCGAKMDLKGGADNESERLPEPVKETR